jgi:hypothetical protein
MSKAEKNVTITVRVNFKIRKDLRDWIFKYSKRTNIPVTRLVEDYFAALKQQDKENKNGFDVEQI